MKSKRQAEIIRIISTQAIETQEDLVIALRQSGYDVTQATISRDIRELQLTKAPGENGDMQYVVLNRKVSNAGSSHYDHVLLSGMLSVQCAQNLIVIRTISGMAMAVTVALESMNWPEILGCIAGDDTIFCAVSTAEEALKIRDELESLY